MKHCKKSLALVLVVLLMMSVAVTGYAADGDPTVEQGKSIEVVFEYSEIYNLDGEVSVEAPAGVVKNWEVVVPNNNGALSVGYNEKDGKIGLFVYQNNDPQLTTIKVVVKIAVEKTAPVDSQILVKITDGHVGVPGANGSFADQALNDSKTVVVIMEPNPPSGDTTNPSNPPSPPSDKVDYTELERQIAIAEGLKEEEYTKDSWKGLPTALQAAKDARTSDNQATVDAAAGALADAISKLVKMDYSQLLAAIAAADLFCDNDQLAKLFEQLMDAIARGQALLNSGDQAAVDACAKEINDLIAQIKAAIAALGNSESKPGTNTETRVEVLPSSDYCNIAMHRVWPVLFFVSLTINAGLALLIIVYIGKKKKNQKDNTPMVDYEIADDDEE